MQATCQHFGHVPKSVSMPRQTVLAPQQSTDYLLTNKAGVQTILTGLPSGIEVCSPKCLGNPALLPPWRPAPPMAAACASIPMSTERRIAAAFLPWGWPPGAFTLCAAASAARTLGSRPACAMQFNSYALIGQPKSPNRTDCSTPALQRPHSTGGQELNNQCDLVMIAAATNSGMQWL